MSDKKRAANDPQILLRRQIYEEPLNSDNYNLGFCRRDYGYLMTKPGRYQEAEGLLLHSLPALRSHIGERHLGTQRTVQYVIELYEAWGKPEKADEYRAMLTKEESK